MKQISPLTYKKYMRMRKIHQGLKFGSYRLGAVLLGVRAILWLLGVDKDFIGFTIYLESVGTVVCAPGGDLDRLGDHQFGLRLWFKSWP